MTAGILERVGAFEPFRPTTVDEYFALQLAKKLNDNARVRQYCSVLSRVPFQQVLTVYRDIERAPSDLPASERLLRHFLPFQNSAI